MADIINLRTARKIRKRAEKAQEADDNRVKFGLPKSLRMAADADRKNTAGKLDQHLRERDKNGDA